MYYMYINILYIIKITYIPIFIFIYLHIFSGSSGEMNGPKSSLLAILVTVIVATKMYTASNPRGLNIFNRQIIRSVEFPPYRHSQIQSDRLCHLQYVASKVIMVISLQPDKKGTWHF